MLVDTTMAELSDLTFRTAFIVYIVALIMAFIYYGRVNSVIEARREALAEQKVLVGAGGPEVVEKQTPESTEFDAKVANARKWAGMTQALVWVGVALHLVAFVTRGLAAKRFPLGNLYEYILFMTAVIMVVAAVVVQRKGWYTVWPWLLFPMVIAMFLNSTVFHMQAAPVVPALQSYWLPVHVSSVSIGASVGLVSGVFALLYLLRMWQPRGEEHGVLGAIARPLPDAKTLDQIAYKTAVVTLPLFGIGIVFGAIWAEVAWGRFWGWDAKETVSMITWILYAAYLHARATAGWKSNAAAWINVFAMAMTIFNMTYVNTVIAGLHSYAGLN
ncbi:c-type cytochrome biogenesis protein CcsB [Corynebacterium sp. zg912]|uniref:C-type cytochrome biogenesis protein CcsB n=1 Tax=Corynebacterium wankanglinii TaxID=2735136 RepID=A0A7H0KAN8_9CORY|nr:MULTISPECIES: c-type cytochrome biogenesis protein CcsB [Corynebacterium]MBA1836653.1 c-type cytochrome biogenesis protein CcsB [Corynebacterium wankanglinii]MCR5929488.1 c-type cytochrome biogenesis protein CcsB [Corynebacterium sp. zg912]QNP94354.1 c-type cytochrome biogenesis protein CcsB [Corynebacterium wankanglinii]